MIVRRIEATIRSPHSPAVAVAPSRLASVPPLLALQRWVGNRAVSAIVQRSCAGGGCCCTRCSNGAAPRPVDERADAPALQRMPVYSPHASWSSKGPGQCADCCEPYTPETFAQIKWAFWSSAFPSEAGGRAGCPEITDVWAQYFRATGGRRTFDEKSNPGSCVILSLKNDDDHLPHEDPILEKIEAALPTLTAGMQPGQDATKPLSDAVGPTPLHPPIVFNTNTRAGGSLLGGLGDSEAGPDTRSQDGVIRLSTERHGPAMTVRSAVEFQYDHRDGVDFCPGNTGEKAPSPLLPFALRQVSKIEASGMARDVALTTRYARVRHIVPHELPIPDPTPVPPNPIRLPSKVLFDFNSSDLRPGAEVPIAQALAQIGATGVVSVVGHTDSRGSDAFNEGLSLRRAEAVRRAMLVQRPDLAGRITADGRGEREPVEPNQIGARDNPPGRAANRRVEISVTAAL
jgi:outer membrane protein OmpA-like peptidoglycan-associated protein